MAGEPVILNNREIRSPGYRFGVDILISGACFVFLIAEMCFWVALKMCFDTPPFAESAKDGGTWICA
jgi:hypothetical protein